MVCIPLIGDQPDNAARVVESLSRTVADAAAQVSAVAIGLDAAPLDLRQTGAAVVFEALGQALHRARRRFGEQRVGDVWRFWSRISRGKVLATNTSAP